MDFSNFEFSGLWILIAKNLNVLTGFSELYPKKDVQNNKEEVVMSPGFEAGTALIGQMLLFYEKLVDEDKMGNLSKWHKSRSGVVQTDSKAGHHGNGQGQKPRKGK